MAKRILIVDDDVDFQQATELILKSAGYEVCKAFSAAEAMKKLQSERVDLVLLDVMMDSDTEGFHMAYNIRQDKQLKNIPIIILTCIEEMTGVGLDPEASGDFLPVEAYLRKPLDAEELTSKIAEVLAER